MASLPVSSINEAWHLSLQVPLEGCGISACQSQWRGCDLYTCQSQRREHGLSARQLNKQGMASVLVSLSGGVWHLCLLVPMEGA